jgi:hypothetical protein
MTVQARRADMVEAAVVALEKAVNAVDDAGLEQEADRLTKEEHVMVNQSVPAGPVSVKDEGDQNARANANWPLSEAEREHVAARLVKLAKELLKA